MSLIEIQHSLTPCSCKKTTGESAYFIISSAHRQTYTYVGLSRFVVKVDLCTAIEGRLSDFVAKVAICTVIKDKTTGSKISCSRKTTNFTDFARF